MVGVDLARIVLYKAPMGKIIELADRHLSATRRVEEERIVANPEVLWELFGDVVAQGEKIMLRIVQFGGVYLVSPMEVSEEEGTMLTRIISRERGDLETGRASCRFELFQCGYVFSSPLLEVSPRFLRISLPSQVRCFHRRKTQRRRVDRASKHRVSLSWGDQTSSISVFPLFDVSEFGFSIIDERGDLPGQIGAEVEAITLVSARKETVQARGVVSSRRWIPEQHRYAIGIEMVPCSREDLEQWHEILMRDLFPFRRVQ